MSEILLSVRERKAIRDRKIRALYNSQPKDKRSMSLVVLEMKSLGYIVSKSTVFFAINGRYSYTKKSRGRKASKQNLKTITKNKTNIQK